jgi:hypothetical protein
MSGKTDLNSDQPLKFALCVVRADGVLGWLLDSDAEVETFSTVQAAEKRRKQLLKNSRYLWTDPVEVREFTGFGKRGGSK